MSVEQNGMTADDMKSIHQVVKLMTANMDVDQLVLLFAGILAVEFASTNDDMVQQSLARLNYLTIEGRKRFIAAKDKT